MIDQPFLKALTEAPSVGTACGPVIRLLTERFGSGFTKTLVEDGFCLFQPEGGGPADLEVLLVAHMDEIGGCVYGPLGPARFNARCWGNAPEIFAQAALQGFDYLEEDPGATFPVHGEVLQLAEERRLVVRGEKIRPYRTVWTFRGETSFHGDTIDGKALDPRVTLYAVVEAVRALADVRVGALLVMAEECAMDVARKAVVYLQRHSPKLKLIVNADVPWIENIGEGRTDMPSIRIFEGRNFIDPSFGIRTADRLQAAGVELHLTAARSGSQTMLFTPLAPTLSVALPSEGVHLPRVRMSLRGTERCQTLLEAAVRMALDG